jgi:hypothetical protein
MLIFIGFIAALWVQSWINKDPIEDEPCWLLKFFTGNY